MLTFVVPAGKFSTTEVQYKDANGETASRTVLQQSTFRYDYPLDKEFVFDKLEDLAQDPQELEKLEISEADVQTVLDEGEKV